ncbi:MAG: hypothetical protein MHPSP_002677, partial [Paramarteilia canceri]
EHREKDNSNDEQKKLLKEAHEIEGELFDLLNPDYLIDKNEGESSTIALYKSQIKKYDHLKSLNKLDEKNSTYEKVVNFQNWLKVEKVKHKENSEDSDNIIITPWFNSQLNEEEGESEKAPERAKDVSVFNIDTYDISSGKSLINVRRRTEKK